MAKLYFSYSAMNAGKSTVLLQASYNYHERGMDTLLLTAAGDDQIGQGVIASRIGLEQTAEIFQTDDGLFAKTENARKDRMVDCVLIDEAQFLSKRRFGIR